MKLVSRQRPGRHQAPVRIHRMHLERSVRPEAPDLIARHLGHRMLGLFATREYLDARGLPEVGTGLAGQDVVVYDSSFGNGSRDRLFGETFERAHVALQNKTGLMLTQAVAAGMGVG